MNENDEKIDWDNMDWDKFWSDEGQEDDWELATDDDGLRPLPVEDVVHAPTELNCKRLEVRDPFTQGRRAWGMLSEDEVFVMRDDGSIYVRWDETTTTFKKDLSGLRYARPQDGSRETFEEQQDRLFMLLSRLKFARIAPHLTNRLERWIHASRLGHWLRVR